MNKNIYHLFYEYLMYKFTKNNLYIKSFLYVEQLLYDNINLYKEEIYYFKTFLRYHKFNAPWSLHLCITDFCQLHCKHCYFDGYERKNQLTLGNIQTIVDKFFNIRKYFLDIGYNDSHFTWCNLSGGEPLLYKDLDKIFNIVNNKFYLIKLLSNGLIYNENIINLLYNSCEKSIYQISIDGIKENHEYIRGNDTFDKTIHTIEKIKSYNPNMFVMVSFNANSINYKDIIEVTRIVKEAGANKIFFDRYVKYWNSEFDILDNNQFIEYSNQINQAYDLYNDDSFIVYRGRSMQCDGYHCLGGVENQVAVTNGDRFACSRYQYKTGNWFTDSVDELCKKSILAEIQLHNIPLDCEKCNNIEKCYGGMRCLTYATKNNFIDKDINCLKNRN